MDKATEEEMEKLFFGEGMLDLIKNTKRQGSLDYGECDEQAMTSLNCQTTKGKEGCVNEINAYLDCNTKKFYRERQEKIERTKKIWNERKVKLQTLFGFAPETATTTSPPIPDASAAAMPPSQASAEQ
mmetsp:Transcript_15087/g.16787  ORF Transcript_15087/g.16787 Transcript_15087/m.16787 type:complete len:128 (+) Transcript_15087:47-430(+)